MASPWVRVAGMLTLVAAGATAPMAPEASLPKSFKALNTVTNLADSSTVTATPFGGPQGAGCNCVSLAGKGVCGDACCCFLKAAAQATVYADGDTFATVWVNSPKDAGSTPYSGPLGPVKIDWSTSPIIAPVTAPAAPAVPVSASVKVSDCWKMTPSMYCPANPIDLKYDNTKNENLKEFRMRCKLQCTEMAQHVGTIRTGAHKSKSGCVGFVLVFGKTDTKRLQPPTKCHMKNACTLTPFPTRDYYAYTCTK